MKIKNIPIAAINKDLLPEYIECSKDIDQKTDDVLSIDETSECYKVIFYKLVDIKRKDLQPGSMGFGDTLAKMTKVTKLDKLSYIKKRITGKPCNCHPKEIPDGTSRQEKFNKLFPYKTDEDKNGNQQ